MISINDISTNIPWLRLAENVCSLPWDHDFAHIRKELADVFTNPLAYSKSPQHAEESYGRKVLLSNNDYEVMLAQWRPYTECAPHDHGFSTGVVFILEGEFAEHSFIKNSQGQWIKDLNSLRLAKSDDQIPVELGDFHSMKNLSEVGITLHFYSPSVENMKVLDLHQQTTITVVNNCGAWIPSDTNKILRSEAWK